MINFFLLAWDPANPEKSAAAKRLIEQTREKTETYQEVFQTKGVAVYANKPTSKNTFPLQNRSGVILGRLFRGTGPSGGAASVDRLSEKESQKIWESRGDYLTDAFWGSYIAVLPRAESELMVGRDCSNLQLCYTTWCDDVFIAFSNMDTLPFLDAICKDINWNYLAINAKYDVIPLIETGLKHVQQMPAGAYAKINLRTKQIEIVRSWKPETFTSDLIEDFETAKRMLYENVLSTVNVQSKNFNNISLNLSGGLDSSILLACLRKTRPAASIHAMHLHSLDNDVSEEHYARAMADAYDVELGVEEAKANVDSNSIFSAPPPWPIPSGMGDNGDEETRKYEKYLEARNIDGIFQGQGGDQIFFKRPQLAPLFDYRRKHLFDLQYYKILLNTARLTGASIWKLQKIMPPKENGLSTDQGPANVFLSSDISNGLTPVNVYEEHPWFQTNEPFSFGKFNQLSKFTMFNFYAQILIASPFKAPTLPPLICQPLMEAALRIPTHFLLAGGRNRGLAREAFKRELVPMVYNRELKGFVTKYVSNTVIRNLKPMREFLLDGCLAKANFLDRGVLEANLNEDRIKVDKIGVFILETVKYEKWVRSMA